MRTPPPPSVNSQEGGCKSARKPIILAPLTDSREKRALSARPTRSCVFSRHPRGALVSQHSFHYPERGGAVLEAENKTARQGRGTKREHVERRIRPGEEAPEGGQEEPNKRGKRTALRASSFFPFVFSSSPKHLQTAPRLGRVFDFRFFHPVLNLREDGRHWAREEENYNKSRTAELSG